MMNKLFESFRRFVEIKSTDITVYKISGLLIIAKRLGRKKEDILSDIRAIEGITTVTIVAHRSTDNLNFSEVRIKIDTTPLSSVNVGGTVAKIKRDIMNVPGVQSIRIVSKPETL